MPLVKSKKSIQETIDLRTIGFERDIARGEMNSLHFYYTLEITTEISIDVSGTRFQGDKFITEESVELILNGENALLSHIDTFLALYNLINILSPEPLPINPIIEESHDN